MRKGGIMFNIAAAALLSIGAMACGGQGAEPDSDTLQDATVARAVPNAARTVPKAVLDFEAKAEDAYDTALKGDIAGVRAAAAALGDLWKKLRKIMQRDGLSSAKIRALDKAVARFSSLSATSTDGVQLARAANAISDTMDDVFELYHPKVPPTLISLDFLGREIVLDCKESALHSAATHLKALEAEWAGIRAKVVKAGGGAQATNLDDALAAARKAIDARDWAKLEKQAQAVLDLVDSMEHDLHW
jgi:hypothetical protein